MSSEEFRHDIRTNRTAIAFRSRMRWPICSPGCSCTPARASALAAMAPASPRTYCVGSFDNVRVMTRSSNGTYPSRIWPGRSHDYQISNEIDSLHFLEICYPPLLRALSLFIRVAFPADRLSYLQNTKALVGKPTPRGPMLWLAPLSLRPSNCFAAIPSPSDPSSSHQGRVPPK